MDRFIVKNLVVLSLIAGGILGLFAPIPYLGTVILFTVLFLIAPLVMVYMIMDGKFDVVEVKNSIIAGAITGFSVNFSFSFVYALMMVILAKVFKYSSNFFLTSMIINSPFWLLFVFVAFIGVLFATTNAFSGFLTYYVINFIRDNYEKQHNNEEK